MSDVDETFESVGAGASDTIPMQAGQLKKGDYVCIKGFPCKIVDVSVSKTGKHGHAKASITALDIFTGKKYEDGAPTSHNMAVPVVKTNQYMLVDIGQPDAAGKRALTLLDDEGEERNDLNLPEDEDLAKRLIEALESGAETQVQVTSAMGHHQVMGLKSSTA